MQTAPIPAATLVVFRDKDAGPPDLLIVERAKAMAFAGGALVFPGGRIDPGDVALAETIGAGEDGAARIAAIRETIEEAGIAVGVEPQADAETLAKIRAALHAGEPFGAALAAAGLHLDLDALVPFARWLPQHPGMRIFDTRFFLARLPDNAGKASVDETENTRLFWSSARDVLADADAGRATIIFPTRRNLERLALFADFAAAVDHAQAHPQRIITPWSEDRDGVPHLCIPDDLGYPVTAQPMADAARG